MDAERRSASAADRGSKKLSLLFEPPTALCVRCHKSVYALEKTVAANGSLFHRPCFSCKACAAQLTASTHKTNPNGGDSEIYCAAHEPAYVPLGLGMDSRGILSAVEATRLHDRWRKIQTIRCPHIRADASFIRHALNSQALSAPAGKQDLTQHQYPPVLLQRRDELLEQLRRAQAELEQEQRQEEEKLLKKFREQRQKVVLQVQQEADRDWQAKLQDIARHLESLSSKNKRQDYDSEKSRLESDAELLVKETRDQNLKVKTLRVVLQQQEETSQLVEKQSERMMEVVQETKKQLQLQLINGAEHEALLPSSPTSDSEKGNGDRKNPDPATAKERRPRTSSITSEAPPVRPPRTSKVQLYQGQTAEQMFRELDEYVINVAATEQATFTELVADLTEDLLTDLAKVRAIYRWITVKDLNALQFHALQHDSPMGLLRGIKFGTETYHTLFRRLCSYVGLHCVEVRGKAKSVGYEPGMKIEADSFRNSWNAVLVDGDWRLVQCNWGARHLVLNKDVAVEHSKLPKQQKQAVTEGSDDNIRYQYDDHYFLTDPEQFIMEFFPDDPKWQLLDQPITLQKFEEQPFVRSIFFQLNLKLLEPLTAVLNTDETGFAQVRIGFPRCINNDDVVFHYQLRHVAKDRASETTSNGIRLDRFVFQTVLDNEVSFKIHVPSNAEFFFEIFANRIKQRQPSEAKSDAEAAQLPLRLKCACKLRIIGSSLQSPELHPLPNCAVGEWGPAKAARQFCLHPLTHPEAVVQVDYQLELKMTTKKAFYFHAKLRSNTIDDKFLDQLVHLRTSADELIIRATFPEPGQYGLDVYARPKDQETTSSGGQPLSHACKYLLNVGRVRRRMNLGAAKLVTLLPVKGRQFSWGAQPACAQLGVIALSYSEPRMRCMPNEPVTLEFRVTAAHVILSAHFVRLPAEEDLSEEDERDMLTISRSSEDGHVVRISATCRRAGDYLLAVIAFERGAKDDITAASCIYNYLLLCSDGSLLIKHLSR